MIREKNNKTQLVVSAAMPRIKISKTHEEKNRNVSRFFILINSNKNDDTDFESNCEAFFQNIDKFVSVRTGYPPLDDNVDISVSFDMEMGDRMKRKHIHALVIINHDTNLIMDFKKLQKWAGNFNYYLESIFVRPGEDDVTLAKIKNYIKKKQKKE